MGDKTVPLCPCFALLAQRMSLYSFFLQTGQNPSPNYKACRKYVARLLVRQRLLPVLLYCAKLARYTALLFVGLQKSFQGYPKDTLYSNDCVKQAFFTLYQNGFKKACSATSLHCQTCTKHAPIAFFVLRKWPRRHPYITSKYTCLNQHCKACTKQLSYHFVPQELHEARSNIDLYYNACTKHAQY